jgi:ribonuclease Z
VRRGTLEIAAGQRAPPHTRLRLRALPRTSQTGRFDAELAASLGVEFGPDFGRLQRGETVAACARAGDRRAARAGRKLVISGDTAPCETLAIAAHGADLLIHEATFGEDRARARGTDRPLDGRPGRARSRSTPTSSCSLSPHLARYAGGELRDEARAVFEDTELPRDFDTIEIPFAERGAPRLIRFGEAPGRPAPAA